MRKVIGIGETVFDIIFKNGQPISGRPGGSVFNAMISLGRMGQHPLFISEVGEDIVGKTVRQCMTDNDVSTDYMCSIDQCKSAVALAFLDAQSSWRAKRVRRMRSKGLRVAGTFMGTFMANSMPSASRSMAVRPFSGMVKRCEA